MALQNGQSPAPRVSAGTGLNQKLCWAAGFDHDLTTERLVVEHLRRRFGVDTVLANTIGYLSGLIRGER